MSTDTQDERERKARLERDIEQCEKVATILRKIKRGEHATNLDGMIVRSLIRYLVEQWV